MAIPSMQDARPGDPGLPHHEQRFRADLRRILEEHLGNPRFNVDELAAELYLCRRQLLRRLYTLLGESPGDLLRRLRLERAAGLLRAGASVKEAAATVGFRSPSHFALAFRDHYGSTPAAWAARTASDGSAGRRVALSWSWAEDPHAAGGETRY